MKPSEIRDMTDDQLLAKETEMERSLFNLRIQYSTGQLDNPARLKTIRRDLARVKTIIRERNLKDQSAGTAACIAIEDQVSVQDVPYPVLRKRLLTDGQILE